MRVILDANLYISLLLKPDGHGTVNRLFDLGFKGQFTILLLDELIAELWEATRTRPYLKERIESSALHELIERISAVSERMPPLVREPQRTFRDPDDDYLLPSAIMAGVDYLVSGDKDVLALRDVIDQPKILTAAEFLDLLDEPGSH
jgi:uncharacterized protein